MPGGAGQTNKCRGFHPGICLYLRLPSGDVAQHYVGISGMMVEAGVAIIPGRVFKRVPDSPVLPQPVAQFHDTGFAGGEIDEVMPRQHL